MYIYVGLGGVYEVCLLYQSQIVPILNLYVKGIYQHGC